MNLLPGIPPAGLGVYAWRQAVPGPWDYAIVSPRVSSAVEYHRARGPIWLFLGPSSWEPSTWRASLADLLSRVDSLGAVGIVANPEAGWQGSSAEERAAFGAALRDAARVTRVGVVTVGGWPARREVSRAAGDAVWWSMELYARGVPPERFGAELERWAREGVAPRSRIVPAIAGFVPDTDLGRAAVGDASAYRDRYLAALPVGAGAAVWEGGLRSYMLPALVEKYGGPLAAARMAGTALAAVSMGPALALVVLVALLALAVFA